jgi:hypothetical protein
MRIHALEASGRLSNPQMGRFQSAAKPDDAAGTNDEAAAAKERLADLGRGAEHLDQRDGARDRAHVPYMAEKISIFGIVVGTCSAPEGIGLLILAFAVFGRRGLRMEAFASQLRW